MPLKARPGATLSVRRAEPRQGMPGAAALADAA
jgi:hypothetical protein